ncbi:MAG: phosphotransferase family protein [Acidimicrobiales bacterium]
MTPPDTYLQPDAPDPVLGDEYVRELIARHADVAPGEVSVDETGGEARTYLCGDVVLKTQRPHRLRPRTSLEKEAFILKEIDRQSTLRVPRVLGYGRDGDVEYEVLSRIPGIALRDATLQVAARSAVLKDLGRVLRQFHELDQARFRVSPLVAGDAGASDTVLRLAEQFDEVSASIEDLGAAVPNSDQLREKILSSVPENFDTVVLHSNPGAEHCFVDPATETFSGLIDFGDSYRSHPALDVRSWRCVEDSREILAGYASSRSLSPGFMDVWRAGMVLSELRLLARGYREAREVSASIAEILSIS